MGSKRRFAAVNTKVRVLKSKLLTKNYYLKLMKKDLVRDQVTYLKEHTAYKDFLENLDDLENIQEVELRLKQYLISRFKKFIPYFTGEYRKLFKFMLLRFEIEDIKLFLRAFDKKEDINSLKEATLLKEFYSKLDYDILSKSKKLGRVC